MVINTSVSSLVNNNILRLGNADLSNRMERLSSGLKINKGADDPSGLAILKGMTAQIRGTNVAIQNCQDGINLIQTMDAGLNEIQDILLRMRELSVRAANEATLTTKDYERLNKEFSALRNETDRIAESSEYNDKQIFNNEESEWSVLLDSMIGWDREIVYSKNGGQEKINLSNSSGDDLYAGFSPDGSKIAFHTTRDGNGEIYIMNSDGSNPINLTNEPSFDSWPQWSPDGSKIAFHTARDGNNEIYSMNSNGSGLVNLTNSAGSDLYPMWSPDGTKICFITNRDGNNEIYVMNADGSGVTNVSNHITSADEWATWSPDSNMILFESSRSGNREVYTVNADGTNLVNISNNPAYDSRANWSPLGDKILFFSNRDGNNEAYLMNPDGTNQINITNNSANDNFGLFSPDGGKIAFYTNRNGNPDVYLMNADGSNPVDISLNASNDALQNFGGWKMEASSDIFRITESLHVGANSGEEYTIRLVKPQMSASSLGISTIILSSASSAVSSIEKIAAAISLVSDARSIAGIQQTHLQHIINDLSAQSINISSARSRIEDTDMAVEATELAKRQILTQSTTAMAAQANSEQQAVLGLVLESV